MSKENLLSVDAHLAENNLERVTFCPMPLFQALQMYFQDTTDEEWDKIAKDCQKSKVTDISSVENKSIKIILGQELNDLLSFVLLFNYRIMVFTTHRKSEKIIIESKNSNQHFIPLVFCVSEFSGNNRWYSCQEIEHVDSSKIKDIEAEKEEDECVVCRINRSCITYRPCQHKTTCCMCHAFSKITKCPICRAAVESSNFANWEKNERTVHNFLVNSEKQLEHSHNLVPWKPPKVR